MTHLVGPGFGVLGALLLAAYFRVVQLEWPGSYFAIDDLTAQRVSVSPLRYGSFRFLPVVGIGGFTAVVTTRSGGNAALALVVLGVIHCWTTVGRRTYELFAGDSRFGRRLQVAMNGVVAIGVIISLSVSYVISTNDSFRAIIPPLQELRGGLWAAFIASLLTVMFFKMTHGAEVSVSQVITRSRRSVSGSLVQYARERAAADGLDADVVEAVLLVENLQRPRWVRQLERFPGRYLGVRTFGIMQVRTDSSVTDRESIDIAVESHLGNALPGIALHEIPDTIRRYNGDSSFIEMVSEIVATLRLKRED